MPVGNYFNTPEIKRPQAGYFAQLRLMPYKFGSDKTRMNESAAGKCMFVFKRINGALQKLFQRKGKRCGGFARNIGY